jgi:putative hemolysin
MTAAESLTDTSADLLRVSARIHMDTGTKTHAPRSTAPSFATRWAVTPADVAAAQRLRFQVFAEEMGAHLTSPGGHDIDEFDVHCQHLLVVAKTSTGADEVVATCRVLMPEGARRAGRLYSEDEFDLSPLRDLLPGAVEMGRVCVAPAWRNGLLILALWRELGQLMTHEGLETLIGCSSVGVAGGSDLAAQLWRDLQRPYLVEPALRVRPWHPLPLQFSEGTAAVKVPPLMKGYLRCGCRLLGPPALDTSFKTADFPIMLRLCDLPSRYAKRVLVS